MSNVDILALGEAMVEFNQTGDGDGRLYLQGFGGDTSNFAIAAARQGAAVAYVSALGDDLNGLRLRQLWAAEGVDDRAVATDSAAYTGIYFVSHDEHGHHFEFFRAGSAASRMEPRHLPHALIAAAQVLHYSGISLAISASARATCEAAVAIARDAGVRVSFDTNLRLRLWPQEVARAAMARAIGSCDICLPSQEDMAQLIGTDDADAIVDHCLGLGAKVVALKLGRAGALVATAGERTPIPPHRCHPVDATGAGDAFGGAFVARLVQGDAPAEAGRYAAVVAALSTEGYGAVAPIPHAERVRAELMTMKP